MRRHLRCSVTLSLFFTLAGMPLGCMPVARQLRPAPASPTSTPSPAAEWGGADASAPAPASAPSAGASMESRQRAADAPVYDVTPAERPGLGTVFGETRYSAVHEVEFQRQSEAPTFLASLHYNDTQGTSALRSRLGGRYSGSEPMFHYYRSDKPYLWGGVTIAVVEEAGQPLPAYHQGEHVLLVGESGQRYSLRIENRTGQRFELVASVDGLDVVDGKLASPGKRGYIVAPHGRLVIDGYRRSMSEVAAFRFGSVRDSYAAQSGAQGDRNVGVIGVALFAERGDNQIAGPELDEEAGRREAADPFPGRFAPPPPHPYY